MAEKRIIDLEDMKADILTVHTKEYNTIDVIPVECIADLPIIKDDKEDKIGEWIFKNDGAYNRTRCYCSICGKHSGIGGIRKNQMKPFCPNCGSSMKTDGE